MGGQKGRTPDGSTPLWKRFAEEYVIDLVATRAYARAGYTDNPSWSKVSRVMAEPAVQAEIKRLMAERSARLKVDHGWVIEQLLNVYSASMKMNPEDHTTFASEKRDFKAASKVVELLGRHIGMFNEKHVHELITQLSDKDLIDKVKVILKNQQPTDGLESIKMIEDK